MRADIPPQLLAHLRSDETAIAFLWSIELADGRLILGTEHDLDITIPTVGDTSIDKYAGTYLAIANVTAGDLSSTTDMSVGNMEVTGAVPELGTPIPDVTVADIESGLLDMAPVTVMVCSWKHPEYGYYVYKGGFLGAINRDSDGKYTTEVRGLLQLLSQTIVETFSVTCSVVKFGDRRCKFNVAGVTITGAVTAQTSRRSFSVHLHQDSPPAIFSYVGGELTFTSGANEHFSREVKLDPNINDGVLEVWEDFPNAIAITDAFTLSPGCDRTRTVCRDHYHNLVNARMYGVFIPGALLLLAGPAGVAEL